MLLEEEDQPRLLERGCISSLDMQLKVGIDWVAELAGFVAGGATLCTFASNLVCSADFCESDSGAVLFLLYREAWPIFPYLALL